MSRDIKFRAKGKSSGKWLYGTGLTDFVNIFPDRKGDIWLWTDYSWVCVDPETVGQFVEQHDKNGIDIYEGDIVHNEKYGRDEKVYFNQGGFCPFSIAGWEGSSDSEDCIVIGNIHEEK